MAAGAATTTAQPAHRQMPSSLSSSSPHGNTNHVAVIVLGDLGRSPRMQYHALSLLENNFRVTLIGYHGEDLIPTLQEWSSRDDESLKVIRFSIPSLLPPFIQKKIKPLHLLLRLMGMLLKLIHVLWFTMDQDVNCLLVQNPPSIPLLFLSFLYTRTPRRRRRHHHLVGLIIDWHNLGFSMFDNKLFSSIAYLYERLCAPLADGHLCVTHAMKRYLNDTFTVTTNVNVLHDRPPSFFKSLTVCEKHEVLKRLGEGQHGLFKDCFPHFDQKKGDTLFTRVTEQGDIISDDRTLLVISSTSWTPDEDFSILLNALVALDRQIRTCRHDKESIPRHILVVVTGKGPLKQYYSDKITALNLTLAPQICITTAWVSSADYPHLMGCADLGVCLHVSTSGRDLPMKVYDMFGCGVPVCAVHFDCLDELVTEGVNGRVFRTAEELAGQMFDLFRNKCERLKVLKEGVHGMTRWNENWDENAKEVILRGCSRKNEDGLVLFMFMILVPLVVIVLAMLYQI